MRRNTFGEAYCTSADELATELAEKGYDPDEVYAMVHPEENMPGFYMAEILTNTDGEPVCYVEKVQGRVGIKNMLVEVGLDPSGVEFI